MEVKDYSFGRIVIGDKTLTSDVIVAKDKILNDNWWRKEGHRVQLEDVKEIFDYKPEVVVFGTGAYGRMIVDDDVVEKLKSIGSEVYIDITGKAVKIYNDMLKKGKKVVLAAHLTC